MAKSSNDIILEESSVTADAASVVVDMTNLMCWSVAVVWTSTTASATVKVQTSNDQTTWIDTDQTQAISNDSGSVMLSSGANFEAAKYLRVYVAHSSGTVTTVTATISAKG